jgi:RNA polymerase sigma-70 factor (ECF subfamily)
MRLECSTCGGWDDDGVVARAVSGDAAALDIVLRGARPFVERVCGRVLNDRDDAADATQHALWSVARSIGRFDRRASFRGWVYRIAKNAALDELRRRGRRAVPAEVPATLGSQDPPMASQVVDRLAIGEALTRLPGEFRKAVELRDVHGHDYAAIAGLLGVPAGTVRSRIARGRARLAAELAA